MLMESQAEFRTPQNISGAPQQNDIGLNWNTSVH